MRNEIRLRRMAFLAVTMMIAFSGRAVAQADDCKTRGDLDSLHCDENRDLGFAVNLAGAVPFAVKGTAKEWQGYNLIMIVKKDSPFQKLPARIVSRHGVDARTRLQGPLLR